MKAGVLSFDEGYFERIWGGRRLETVFGKPLPSGKPYGEAWLISDHAEHVSTAQGGAHDAASLHAVMETEGEGLLGPGAAPTVHGQFPLLLKILDAADWLSVQVHPNDEDAARLGEPDVGKTEMWYVLDAEPGAELICGMPPELTREAFRAALEEKRLGDVLTRFPVEAGTAVFVPAGTVHAIGPGVLIAEIQQNSNITYRVYDWDRVQADGKPRTLHIQRSLDVARFGSRHAGANRPLAYEVDGARITVLAACRYFAAERVEVGGAFTRGCEGFRILFGLAGDVTVEAGGERRRLEAGRALLVPAASKGYRVECANGTGSYLEYFVPDLAGEVVAPLRAAGHGAGGIVALGGDGLTSDLAGVG